MAELDGYGAVSIAKLLAAIDSRRQIGMARFIYSLGIRQVGQATARLLALHYGQMDQMMTALNPQADLSAAHAALVEIDQIGAAMADDIISFFGNADLYQIVQNLLDVVTVLPQNARSITALYMERSWCSPAPLKICHVPRPKPERNRLVPKFPDRYRLKLIFWWLEQMPGQKPKKRQHLALMCWMKPPGWH